MILIASAPASASPRIGNASLHEVTGEDSSLASGVQAAMQQVGGALGWQPWPRWRCGTPRTRSRRERSPDPALDPIK